MAIAGKVVNAWRSIGLGFLVAAIPYALDFYFIIHKGGANPYKSDEFKSLLYALGAFIMGILIIYFSIKLLRKLTKAEALAHGYFFNFLYETVHILRKNPAVMVGNDQISIAGVFPSYKDIMIIVVVPEDLHGYYCLAETIGKQPEFTDKAQVVAASSGEYTRSKLWKSIIVSKNGKSKLVLIDIPPTTLRTSRIFRESKSKLDHYKHQADMEDDEKKLFNKICRSCTKESNEFVANLKLVLKSESAVIKAPDFEGKIKVIRLEDLINETILNDPAFERLRSLSNNNHNDQYKNSMEEAEQLVKQHMPEIVANLTEKAFEKPARKRTCLDRIKWKKKKKIRKGR